MEEIQSFLINDTTDERIYNNNQMPYYTCGHFTQDLITNASKPGIGMYPVYLNARIGCGHIIAAVKVNGTWIFIEPLNDGICPEKDFGILKRTYKSYQIGTHIRCSPYSELNRVRGLIELGMF